MKRPLDTKSVKKVSAFKRLPTTRLLKACSSAGANEPEPATVMVNRRVAMSPSASRAVYAMPYEPTVVGVPDRTRVVALKLRPATAGLRL